MSRSVAPISLTNLFTDLDFLAGIQDKQKYCFAKRYYVTLNWLGAIFRILDSEAQDINGIATMEAICTNASEQWTTYKNNKTFGPTLLNKIVAARHGLNKCALTYESLQKNVTASNIRSRAILTLDNTIPYERKIKEGIVLENDENNEILYQSNSKEQGRSRLNSTTTRSPDSKEIVETNFPNSSNFHEIDQSN